MKKLLVLAVMCVAVLGVTLFSGIKSKASSAPSIGEGKDAITDEDLETKEPSKENVEKYMTYAKGTVSHVCYLYVDKDGKIIYDTKDDSAGNKTKVILPSKQDHNLVVFVKQSTTGMIWSEEELSDKVLNDVIEVIKKKDKSYKGHEDVVYGYGEHKLIYKKGKNTKTVVYNFGK